MPASMEQGDTTRTAAVPTLESIQNDIVIYSKARNRKLQLELQTVKEELKELLREKKLWMEREKMLTEQIQNLENASLCSRQQLDPPADDEPATDGKPMQLSLKSETKHNMFRADAKLTEPGSQVRDISALIDDLTIRQLGASSQPTEHSGTAKLPHMPSPQPLMEESDKGKVIVDAITDDMIDWLTDEVSHTEWPSLMRKLNVKSNIIDECVANNPNNSKEQRASSYRSWKKSAPREATVDVLLDALERANLRSVKRQFRKVFHFEEKNFLKGPSGRGNGQTFVNHLHELVCPFLVDKFEAFWEHLSNSHIMLTGLQCKHMGYAPNKVPTPMPLDHLLIWKSSIILSSRPPELEKRQQLCSMILICGKKTRDIFRLYVAGGVIGPALDGNTSLENISYATNEELKEKLSKEGVPNWKNLYDYLRPKYPTNFHRVGLNTLDLWGQHSNQFEGASNVLNIWCTTTEATVEALYWWAVVSGRLDIAQVLER